MIPTRGENYKIEIYHRKENSPYEWEDHPSLICYGRPANQVEKRIYRIQKGVVSGSDSTYIYCTNLPENITEGDRIDFIGKTWKVESIGYYFDENLIVNPRIMNDKYLIERCPKGITLH